jgi:glycosyltransferase involved in cell wall biosynthesis
VEVIVDSLSSCGIKLEIIVVDDGSRDETFERIRNLSRKDPRVKGLRFTRNFGKEAALLAGLRVARGDAVVTIDSDLQHPPALIPRMLDEWRKGAMVVDAVKRGRQTDSALARLRAKVFNSLLSRLGGINLQHSSDFKLLDRRVVDAIARELPERQRFYRGLADWVGYRHSAVPFDVEARADGEGKWTFWRLVELATTATVSFTSAPLRIVTILGMLTFIFGFAVGTEALISWFRGSAVSGFTTIITTLLILGSLIMISLGIIGEYIAKIYDEIKARPTYLVEGAVGFEDDAMLLSARAMPEQPALIDRNGGR